MSAEPALSEHLGRAILEGAREPAVRVIHMLETSTDSLRQAGGTIIDVFVSTIEWTLVRKPSPVVDKRSTTFPAMMLDLLRAASSSDSVIDLVRMLDDLALMLLNYFGSYAVPVGELILV